ncbi:hypothetical protein NDU88_000612 [Pleurodeles waltl]|uniref:Uncharacterized protein n=1 Tax=Pleurodeles waltl TaxID=8319 RepID=A0AAV7RAI1_PLEWA|nr:hypothetical protein NDU88_000612 [Pleurodeles waltl]
MQSPGRRVSVPLETREDVRISARVGVSVSLEMRVNVKVSARAGNARGSIQSSLALAPTVPQSRRKWK